MTRDLVLGEQLRPTQIRLPPRVLLIDEVDVFFSADFYGRTFNPITLFVDQNKHIEAVMHEIWRNRDKEALELQN
jgi:hypothetical protein